MDEETFNKIVTEVSTFYRTITTPFLNRMSDNDRENAVLWSQKVMSLKNYDSLTKYLTYLTFMIINGRLVTPFDTDPHTSQIPPLPVHVGETKMLDFIEKVVAQCQAVQDNDTSQSTAKTGEISAAISSDELAFISTQPTPGVGIRMYLATSVQPFAMWSKANGTPQAVKYNVPAREVIDRGLAVAKEKFYSYLDEIERQNKQNGTGGPSMKCAKCQKPAPAGNLSTCIQDTSKSTNDGTISDISFDYGNSTDTSNRSTPTDGGARVPRQAQQEASRDPAEPPCTLRNLPRAGQDAVAGSSGLTTSTTTVPPTLGKNDSFRSRPPEPLSDDDKRRETEIDEKYERWFGEPQYIKYKNEIRGFLREGMTIDAIRRALHTHMRQKHNPNQNLPLYVYDSEDESVPYEIRITHLRERYADVLQNEYGIVDEAELYYLLGLTGLSKKNMEKARELIKYAEEGLIDDDFRKKFHSVQGRTCGRLLPIIEELLQSARKSANSSANTSTSHPSVAPSSTNQSASSNQNSTNGRLNASSFNHRTKSMPPTSTMETHSDDTTDTSTQSNQSNIENEPEPEFFQNIQEVDQSNNNTSNQANSTSNSTQNATNRSESELEPDGTVYPYCPRENCKD